MSSMSIRRRELLGGAAGAALAGAATASGATAIAAAPRRADVVVVGAGLAGLTAAVNVAAKGRSVIVLEARKRVGGRVWNHELGGGHVSERGGTFVGPTQDHILALLKRFGMKTFDTYDTGDDVYISPSGQRFTWSDTGITGTAPPDPTILAELATTTSELDSMSTKVPIDAPWDAASAAEWDGQTLETWINANTATSGYRQVVPLATRPIFGAEPRDLSLLFVLFYIAASGNEKTPGTFERNFDTRNGGQMSRVVGGTQLLAMKMAKRIGTKRVLLGHPVRRIRQDRTGVTVTADGVTVRAKQVVVAIPPALAGRIDYHPLLPYDRDQLTQRLGQGLLTKVAAVYSRPFWRDAGLTGQGLSATGLVAATFDDSPPGKNVPGVLFGFVGGDQARNYDRMSKAQRRQNVINEYAQFFGDAALKPKAFFDTQWAKEEWTRGCPVGLPSTGTLLRYGPALRRPAGRIHWAGTETSTYWNGYMDGAVRSGERAAREVLDEL